MPLAYLADGTPDKVNVTYDLKTDNWMALWCLLKQLGAVSVVNNVTICVHLSKQETEGAIMDWLNQFFASPQARSLRHLS